jgi:hypothetical protein
MSARRLQSLAWWVLTTASAMLMAGTMIAACITSGCTPAEQQLGARILLAGGEIACIEAARCSGIMLAEDLADFCRVSADETRRYLDSQADAAEGPSCPIEDSGADR